MEINAVYEKGRVYFDKKLKFKKSRIPIRVVVDDENVEILDSEIKAESGKPGDPLAFLRGIRLLLGSDYKYIPSEKTDKELLLEAIEEKYCR